MKDRAAERFLLLSFGCASRSSVAVGAGGRGQQLVKKTTPETCRVGAGRGPDRGLTRSLTKYFFLPLPKPRRFAAGFRRFINTIKRISHQFFFYKEEVETEDEETEIEIGFPTDVKHLTHVGLDGTTTTIQPIRGWELNPPETMSLPSISLRQFEIAMAAQTHGQPAASTCPPPPNLKLSQGN